MTTFYYQPQASEVGTLPSIFSSLGIGSPWPDIQVVDAGGGTYVLRFVGSTWGPTRNAVLSGAGTPGSFSDGEVYVKLKMADWAILSAQIRSGGAGSSSAASTYYSAALDGRGSGNIRLKDTALNAGSFIRDTEVLTKGSAVGVFLHLMVKASGTTISVKMWKDGESEPAYSTYTDSTLTTGYAALMTGEGTSDVYFIGVGTGTDAAPRSAGGGNGTATGTPDSLDLIAPTATGNGTGSGTTNGSASGTPSSASLSAPSATGTGTTAGNGTITTPALKNNTGTVLASISGWTVNVYNASTGALVVQKTGLATNASGIMTIADAAIVSGTSYTYEPVHATYGRRLPTGTAS